VSLPLYELLGRVVLILEETAKRPSRRHDDRRHGRG